jgi:flagellar biosynthesis protein FlhB
VAGGEKTEAPTPRRREEVRKKGNVPRSTELNSALALLTGVLVLKSAGTSIVTQMLDLMRASFRGASFVDWSVASVNIYGIALGLFFLGMMTPLFAAMIGVGAVGNLLQSGFVFSPRPLSPDMSRINPFKGFQRIFSQRSLVELAKSLAKLAIVGYVVYQAFQERYFQVVSLTGGDVHGTIGLMADISADIALKDGFALLILAGLVFG